MAKALLAVVVFIFVGRFMVRHLGDVRWPDEPICWPLALGAVPTYALFVICRAGAFRLAVRAAGGKVAPQRALLAATIPPLLRYIPGRVAATAGTVAYLSGTGTGVARASVAAVLAGLTNVASATLLLVAGTAWREAPAGDTLLLWALAGLALCAVGLHPSVLRCGVRLMSRLTRQPIDGFQPHPLQTLRMVGWTLLSWIALGTGYALVGLAVGQIAVTHVPTVVWSVAAATTVGFLAVFAPAGLGVREGALLLLLSPTLGAPAAAMLAVLGRCWQTLLELAAAGVVWPWARLPVATTAAR
ncbi:MAG: hypothetical protein ACOC95_04070 [Planctomycetota bacterium]